jgi:hypothetical protein
MKPRSALRRVLLLEQKTRLDGVRTAKHTVDAARH